MVELIASLQTLDISHTYAIIMMKYTVYQGNRLRIGQNLRLQCTTQEAERGTSQ